MITFGLYLMMTAAFDHSLASTSPRPVVQWQTVEGGAIENFGRDEATFYPAANLQSKPESFGLYPTDRIPTAGGFAAVVRCIELRQARIGGQTWYRFRLANAYGPSRIEYDWCRQRKSIDACDSTVPVVCEGRYYYLPRSSNGVHEVQSRSGPGKS